MLSLAHTSVFPQISLLRGLRLLGLIVMTGIIALAPLLSLPAQTYAQTPGQPNAPTHPLDLCKEGKFSGCISAIFYYLFVETTAIFAYFGGVVFDYVASIALNSGTYASTLINQGWTIARDVANMGFLFLIVFLGMRLILNLEGVGAGKTLAKILAVALIINFSFFFTRVVIDASNLLAHQFYDHINGRTAAASDARGGDIFIDSKPLSVKHISENVMGGLNVQQVIGNASFKAQIEQGGTLGNVALLTGLFFVFGIINLVLAFIFFVAALQFIARIVTLWLTIMLAPLGFMAFIIPGLGKYTGIWWNTLIKNAFFAPAFLFVFYIIIMFLDGGLLSSGTGGALYSSGNTTSTGADAFFRPLISIVIRLAIVVALLKAALQVGDYFAQASAKTIVEGGLKYAGTAASIGLGGIRMMRFMGSAGAVAQAGTSNVTRPGRAQLNTLRGLSAMTAPATIPQGSLATTVTSGNQPVLRVTGERARAQANAQQEQELARLNATRTIAPTPQQEAPTLPPARAENRIRNAGLPNVFSQRSQSNAEVVTEIRNVTSKVDEVKQAILNPIAAIEASSPQRTAPASIGTLDRLRTATTNEASSQRAAPTNEAVDALRASSVQTSLSQVEKAARELNASQNRPTPPQAPAVAAAPQSQGPRGPVLSAAQAVPQQQRAPTLQQAGDGRISQVERLSKQVTEEARRVDRNATNAVNTLKKSLGDSSPEAAAADASPPDLRGGTSA